MRILITEDDAETAQFIDRGLSALGHDAVYTTNGIEAFQRATTETFDVIVLDRMLPDLDGLSVLRHLRASSVRTPVIVLTALGGIADRVEGLEAGADDYLIKPFDFAELAARLNALARRPPLAQSITILEVGDVTIDLLRREATRGGKVVQLQPRELALLEVLMRHAGQIVTRSMFLEAVWGYHFHPQTNIVESHLSRLRTKLREGFTDDPIETIRSAGYRMRGDKG